MTTTNEKLTLTYGCNRGLPDGVRVAWGARAIAPWDLLPDRMGCEGGELGGPERTKLLEWLNVAGPKAEQVAAELRVGRGDGRYGGASEEVATLHEDEVGKIVASSQGSHGYVYIAAWLHEHVCR